ncbi:MAG TPA: polymer-forming cytoskeletal protein [Patescibacteria group bacterium]|nr:polymer-forming cytoskeletal protein [Patescibacteria group bacterium]
MFNKQSDPQNKSVSKKVETIIGPAIKVKGNFHGQGNTVVEGELEGSLKTDADVFVGDNAKILANIEAKTARLGGQISGDIKILSHLEIVASAHITGNIECESLTVESGAVINGEFKMAKSGDSKKESRNKNEEAEAENKMSENQ